MNHGFDMKPEPKTYGLDYDDTYTSDPELWQWFIRRAQGRGHTVYIVTCRHDTHENREEVYGDRESTLTGLPWSRHIFTGFAAKKWFCEHRGLKIDIWIDDYPESIINGR